MTGPQVKYMYIHRMPKISASEHIILALRTRTTRTLTASPKAEFLDEIQTKVLKVFLLTIHNHLYSFALKFLFPQTHAMSSTVSTLQFLYTVKEKGGKPDRKPYPFVWFKKSIQKPQV
jgi:hypothetical protein